MNRVFRPFGSIFTPPPPSPTRPRGTQPRSTLGSLSNLLLSDRSPVFVPPPPKLNKTLFKTRDDTVQQIDPPFCLQPPVATEQDDNPFLNHASPLARFEGLNTIPFENGYAQSPYESMCDKIENEDEDSDDSSIYEEDGVSHYFLCQGFEDDDENDDGDTFEYDEELYTLPKFKEYSYDADESDYEEDKEDDTFASPVELKSQDPPAQTDGGAASNVLLIRHQKVLECEMVTTYKASIVARQAGLNTAKVVCTQPPLYFVKVVKYDWRIASMDPFEKLAYHRIIRNPLYYIQDRKQILSFILPLDAFVDRGLTNSEDRMFIFELCQSDLLAVVNNPGRHGLVASSMKLWLTQIAAGIHYLHSIGIIHRDIKTENVLLNWQNNALITDLGLAYTHRKPEPLNYSKAYCFRRVGTDGFLAPEIVALDYNETEYCAVKDQFEENPRYAEYGPSCDWWSYGLMAFEIASYKRPRDARKLSRAYRSYRKTRRGNDFAAAVRFFNDYEIPPDLAKLLWGVLEPNPEHRFILEDLYHHEYFLLNNESIFDKIGELSANRPMADHTQKPTTKSFDGASYTIEGATEIWINDDSPIYDIAYPPKN